MPLSPYALTSVADVRAYAGWTAADAPDALVESLINAATDVIEQFCRRKFAAREYREFQDGPGDAWLLLKQRPIVTVRRVITERIGAFWITYSLPNASQAEVNVSEDGTTMTLRSVVLGSVVTNTITLTAAASDTLAELAAVITALAGWTAHVASDTYGGWRSSNLWPVAGLYCLGTQQMLEIAGAPETTFSIHWDAGELRSRSKWPSGHQNILVEYRAGYEAGNLPAGLVQVCIDLAKKMFDARAIDSNLKSERLGPWAYTLADGFASLSPDLKERLTPYRESFV